MAASDHFQYELLHPARDALFKQANPKQALDLLGPFLKDAQPPYSPYPLQARRAIIELACLAWREQQQFAKAAESYRSMMDNYQAGYCELLMGNMAGVQNDWIPLLSQRNNHWCLTLYGLVTQQLNSYPTIFQIRNHLESDIGNLISAKQWEALTSLLSYSELLSQINMEALKFAGRALLNSLLGEKPLLPKTMPQHPELLNQAGIFLLKGQKILPNDPEVYYHLGQYHWMTRQTDDALLMLKQCLMISPSYTPAKELMAVIKAA